MEGHGQNMSQMNGFGFSVGWVTSWTAKTLVMSSGSSTTPSPCQSKHISVRTAHAAFSRSDSL